MASTRSTLRIPTERRLSDSLEAACRRELLGSGFQLDGIGDAEWGDALRAYCGVLHRSIEPKPRNIQRSKELQLQLKATIDPKLLARVRAVEVEMSEGLDLNVRLSRKYYNASYNDPLLNDLNVHHFHVGERAQDPKKLCKQSKELLYGVVDDDAVCLVHLGDHLSFRTLAFEKVMFANWPHFFTEIDLLPSPDPWPNEERASGRHCGLSMPVQIDGKIYMPPWSGQTMSGTSIRVNHRVNQLIHQVREGRKWVLQREEWIMESMTKHGRMTRTLALEVDVAGMMVWFVDRAIQVWMCPRSGELRFPQFAALREATK